jgi:hypothetical protein
MKKQRLRAGDWVEVRGKDEILLARGIFTSIPDLARQIRRYIARYNQDPKPIRWIYSNPAHRITSDSAETVDLSVSGS